MILIFILALLSSVLSAPIMDSTRSLDSLVYSGSEDSLIGPAFAESQRGVEGNEDVIERIVGIEEEEKIDTHDVKDVGEKDEKEVLEEKEDEERKRFFGVGWDHKLNGFAHVDSVRLMKEIRERKRLELWKLNWNKSNATEE
jgi:hypothetical protein